MAPWQLHLHYNVITCSATHNHGRVRADKLAAMCTYWIEDAEADGAFRVDIWMKKARRQAALQHKQACLVISFLSNWQDTSDSCCTNLRSPGPSQWQVNGRCSRVVSAGSCAVPEAGLQGIPQRSAWSQGSCLLASQCSPSQEQGTSRPSDW